VWHDYFLYSSLPAHSVWDMDSFLDFPFFLTSTQYVCPDSFLCFTLPAHSMCDMTPFYILPY